MKANNLFSYATKELAQDAFLCWLINWFNFDSPLKELAKKLLDMILSRSGYSDFEINTVQVLRQYNHIDILLVINKTLAIIIEDKTNTSEHGNQISRYANMISSTGKIITDIEEYSIEKVLCVYYKTAEYVYADEKVILDDSVVKITRKDMLSLISPYVSLSEILNDYYVYMKEIDDNYAKIEMAYLNGNFKAVFAESYMQWRYIKDNLSVQDENGRRIIPRGASMPEKHASIEQGSTYGKPFTWYWFSEFSNNVPEEKILTEGRFLGYRFDTDDKGAFVSLKMYCKYDKGNTEAKEKQRRIVQHLCECVEPYVQGLNSKYDLNINTGKGVFNYECEIFKCYINEKVVGHEKAFASMIRTIQEVVSMCCEKLKNDYVVL